MRSRRAIALGLAAAALATAGCSEETSEDAAEKEGGGKADLRQEAEAPPETSGELKEKPRVRVPKGDPPKQLQKKDLVEGEGGAAQAGSTVSINYVGVSYSDGKEFDTSFGKEPLEFQLGSRMVIPGFEEGIEGMKVGGRRQLIIPPDKAYGAKGQPPVIGPNETLVFVVDLLGAK